MQIKYKHVTIFDIWSPDMFMKLRKDKGEEISWGSGNNGHRLTQTQNTMQHQLAEHMQI